MRRRGPRVIRRSIRPRARSVRWSSNELNYLSKNYKDTPAMDIAKHLGRSYHAVLTRAGMIGVWKVQTKEWTAYEEKFLRKHYPTKGAAFVASALKRDSNNVMAKANIMGVYSKVSTRWKGLGLRASSSTTLAATKLPFEAEHLWTRREIAYIKECGESRSLKLVALDLKIYYPHVCAKARELGITRGLTKEWTEEEVILLRELAKTMQAPEIGTRLGRTTHAVRVHAERNNILLDKFPGVSRAQEKYLMRNYKKMEYGVMAEHLGIPTSRVMTFLNRDRGVYREVYHEYTGKDRATIRRYYKKKSATEIGEMIGVSRQSVVSQAAQLGLNKRVGRWTRDQEEYVRKWYQRKTTKEIAVYVGREPLGVRNKARAMGLFKLRGKYLPYKTEL